MKKQSTTLEIQEPTTGNSKPRQDLPGAEQVNVKVEGELALQAKPTMSVYQINELTDQYNRLGEDIENVRESQQPILAALKEIAEKEAKVKRLLFLTDDILGFARERELATDVLQHCAEQRSDVEARAQGHSRRITQLLKSRGEIDRSWFAKSEEIQKLARELKF